MDDCSINDCQQEQGLSQLREQDKWEQQENYHLEPLFDVTELIYKRRMDTIHIDCYLSFMIIQNLC